MMIKEMYPTPAAACARRRSGLSAAADQAGVRRDGARQQAAPTTAGSGAGTAGTRTRAGRRLAGARRRAPTRAWASASTAPTATPRRKDNSDLRVAEEHQGRARRAAGLPEPELLPRPVVAEPAERASSRPAPRTPQSAGNDPDYNPAFTRIFYGRAAGRRIARRSSRCRPRPTTTSGPKPGEPTAASQFITSDQCLGCHSAGGTGLQYDMTQPGPDGQADQHLALRHVARLADGAGGARPDLLRAARERDRDVPPGARADRSRTPASAATASMGQRQHGDRHARRDRQDLRAVRRVRPCRRDSDRRRRPIR